MTAAAALWLLLSAPLAAPAWCDDARSALQAPVPEGDQAWPHYEQVIARMAEAPIGILEASRLHTGEEGDVDRALNVLRGGLLVCRPEAPDAEVARERASGILADTAFGGEREQPDLIDQLVTRFQTWVLELLESEGMQKYAEGSRFVYLTALVLGALYIAYRLWRARRQRRLRVEPGGEDEAVVRRRMRDARALLAEARQAAAAGQERDAVRLGFVAVLASVGEHEPGAVAPSRTSREILDRLSAARQQHLAGVFAAFETLIYRGRLSAGDAEPFLNAVQTQLGDQL